MTAAATERAGWSRAFDSSILSIVLLAPFTVGCVATSDAPPEDTEGGGNSTTGATGMEPGTGCTQGQQVGCPCGGGLPDGIQVCNTLSVWDACQCGGAVTGTGGNAATGGGTAVDSGGTAAPGSGGNNMTPSGSGGSNSPGDACATSVTDMVTDMETEVPSMPPMLNVHAIRQGPWYSDHGMGASVTSANGLDAEIVGGRCDSTRAVHAVGDSAMAHSLFGFDFNSTGGVKEPYSLTATGTGFAFFARGSGILRVELTTTDLDPSFDCTGDACHGYHGALIELTDDWALVEVPYASLEQAAWSASEQVVNLNLANAIGLQFQFQGTGDAWIDDVGFY